MKVCLLNLLKSRLQIARFLSCLTRLHEFSSLIPKQKTYYGNTIPHKFNQLSQLKNKKQYNQCIESRHIVFFKQCLYGINLFPIMLINHKKNLTKLLKRVYCNYNNKKK